MRAALAFLVLCLALLLCQAAPGDACTGIRMKSQDGGVVYGRTMEWGTFDLNSRVVLIPRGYAFAGLTPDGANGKKWTGKYCALALDMAGKDYFADGMNERGLGVGMFYHPGFAEYAAYDKSQRAKTLTALDMAGFLLTNFASVEEVRAGLKDLRVVSVVEPTIGAAIPSHWMVMDTTGAAIVIECTGGKVVIHDAPLGVITNAPNYDWHMTNLRNHVNLSPFSLPTKKVESIDFAPLGGGSGMIGLPGDNTPPSRFVRAAAWTSTARKTATNDETVYETFRILDNFNLPLGAAEGHASAAQQTGLMRSSTIWTAAWDLNNKVLYYHTQHNRRVRMVDMKRFDMEKTGGQLRRAPLDKAKAQDYETVTLP